MKIIAIFGSTQFTNNVGGKYQKIPAGANGSSYQVNYCIFAVLRDQEISEMGGERCGGGGERLKNEIHSTPIVIGNVIIAHHSTYSGELFSQ